MSVDSIKCTNATVGQMAKAIKRAVEKKPELVKLMRTQEPDSFTKAGRVSKKVIMNQIYMDARDYFEAPFSKKSTFNKQGKKIFEQSCKDNGLKPSMKLSEFAKLYVKDKTSKMMER